MLLEPEIEIQNRTDRIKQWYEDVFPKAATFVKSRGGSLEKARDIFQEAVIIYYEKLNGEFDLKENDNAYLIGIVRNLWLKSLRNSKQHDLLQHENVAEQKSSEIQTNLLLEFLKKSGEQCLRLLESFYYKKLNMNELALRFGYKSERSATVQKYKCIEKLRNEVKSKSISYEDFLD